jgi:hypothetical protein
MSRNTLLIGLVISMVIAAVSFYSGMYYMLTGGSVPGFIAMFVPHSTIGFGTVVSTAANSVTVKSFDGTETTYVLSNNTHIQRVATPTDVTFEALVPGAVVSVTASGNQASSIQITPSF